MRIGAACKWQDSDGTQNKLATFKTTTAKYISTLTKKEKLAYFENLLDYNMKSLKLQIELVGSLPQHLRMWRLGSEILPLRTHPAAKDFYDSNETKQFLKDHLANCGKLARKNDVRLSFHPGQFVVLGSEKAHVREASLQELKFHCDVFSMMGYKGWHDHNVCVNIHVGLKNPKIEEMRALLQSSENIKNFVTLENDEFSWGARQIVETFGDIVPVVLDVHHYLIMQERQILAESNLSKYIQQTWKGTRPKLHLSMSDKTLTNGKHVPIKKMLARGIKKTAIRVHSDDPWNTKKIDYVKTFLPYYDIMWEGKDKNIGSANIAKHIGLVN